MSGWRNLGREGPAVFCRVIAFAIVAGSLGALQALADDIPAGSRLSDEPIPMATELQRPKPLVEIGDHFLDTGKLQRGIHMPGGAVWQPSLLVFGDYQTAVQTFDDGNTRYTEWVNRLNVFANLQLTGTERAIVGFRPLDDKRVYLGYQWEPNSGFQDEANGNIDVAFFEGNLKEMFPDLDPKDTRALDYAFSVGRQPILLQDGILLNDTMDAVGVVRNSVHTPWTSGVRFNVIHAWDHIHRNNVRDDSAKLVAGTAFADLYWTTADLDVVYMAANRKTGEGLFAGLSGIQRVPLFGESISTTLRVIGSYALHQETPTMGSGVLFYGEMGRSPIGTPDWMYLDAFWGIEKFTSAARDIDQGGPLGRTGILFEALALGHYGAPLGDQTANAWGGAVGYQRFWDLFRRQLIVEVGGSHNTLGGSTNAFGVGSRLQQAFGRHLILGLRGFVAGIENRGPGYGGRGEAQIKF
jgi:hypothetical protein